MSNLMKKSNTLAFGIISVIFTFVPESLFGKYKLMSNNCEELNIILNRFIVFFTVYIFSIIINLLYLKLRKKIRIKGRNYSIQIQYGNIFKMRKCKKIIPFDECFTTSVGDRPADINPKSICGQYLTKNPNLDIKSLIERVHLCQREDKSKYQDKECYTPGILVPNGDDLLLAFAKLNKSGLGELTRKEYLDCLTVLWEEIDKYYGQKDIAIPILGSGVTRLKDETLTQQELLDLMIYSYKLSKYKIKVPSKLYIICRKREDFSLNNVGEVV